MTHNRFMELLEKQLIYVDMPFDATAIDVDMLTNENLDTYAKK